ncbi:MAG TPA: DUF2155 domain-containing protein [Pseudolabrys sp.]|nr:DUF2155 domain-containing protein [Pseudolabrys sp.]
MARSFAASLIFTAALAATAPAAAQFGSIFNEPPPRPPADVPNAPPPQYERRSPPPYYPTRQSPPPQRTDEPPAAPLPAPMSLPPQNRPGGGTIQSQELPPPPGAQQAKPASPPPAAPLQPQQPANAAPAAPPQHEVVVEPPPERIANPTAVFRGLDKITGRITSFDVAINETVQFGALQVTPRVCYSRPPTETPQTDAFVEVDEVTLQGAIKRIFTGWIFAASPGLHAVEHPIYDVWLTDCKGGKLPAVAEAPADEQEQKPATKPPPKRAPARPPQPRGFAPALR